MLHPRSRLQKPALRRLFPSIASSLALGAALLLANGAHAEKLTDRTKQKRAAESERAELQQKLSDLKRDIHKTETARGHAADALAQSEQAISEANRALHGLAQEQQQTQARLDQLTTQQTTLARTIDTQQKQLAKLIREQYMAGTEDRFKLLLSGDNPNRISRELHYLSYVSQAQAKLLDSLKTNLQDIETNKEQARNAKAELDEIAQEAHEQKQVLEKEKTRRAGLLAELSNKLAAQRKEAGSIQRDEQRLGNLVNRLSELIEQQQKADAAAALRRQQEAARAKEAQRKEAQKRKQLAQKREKAGKPANTRPNPDAIDDDAPPPKMLARNELPPEAPVQTGVGTRPFSSLRGQLVLPVRGELVAKYGSRREDGPAWKGWFIRAAEGTDVKAVAAGRVVFAEWLRGFGNLIIVDHGSQYLTIYGNNQAVLKHTGDVIKAGETIASAGNSGGNAQSGLYFEMRHQGRAFDPLGWINIR